MTPTELETKARQRYNAVGDTFFPQDEIFYLIQDACNQLAHECNLIKQVYSTSTVASQREYSYPTNTIAIKRVEYEGRKITQISFNEDDAVTGGNSTSTQTGTPIYYYIWNEVLYLRPTPNAVGTLRIFSYNEHPVITSTSTIEVPEHYHMDLVNYVVSEMAAKDSNFNAAQYYLNKWERKKEDIKRWVRKQERADRFALVQDEDLIVDNFLGVL